MNDGDSVCFRLAIEDKTEEIGPWSEVLGCENHSQSTSREDFRCFHQRAIR